VRAHHIRTASLTSCGFFMPGIRVETPENAPIVTTQRLSPTVTAHDGQREYRLAGPLCTHAYFGLPLLQAPLSAPLQSFSHLPPSNKKPRTMSRLKRRHGGESHDICLLWLATLALAPKTSNYIERLPRRSRWHAAFWAMRKKPSMQEPSRNPRDTNSRPSHRQRGTTQQTSSWS